MVAGDRDLAVADQGGLLAAALVFIAHGLVDLFTEEAPGGFGLRVEPLVPLDLNLCSVGRELLGGNVRQGAGEEGEEEKGGAQHGLECSSVR